MLDHALECVIARDIAPCTADARPIRMEALAAQVFHDVVDELALIEAVEEARESAQVKRSSANAEQVILNAAQFRHDGADHFATRGWFDAKEALDAGVERNVIDDRRDVIHPADGAHVLVVVVVLAEFFEPGVQVADVRGDARDAFAIKLHDQAQRGVRGRMLRSDVEDPTVRQLNVVAQVVGIVRVNGDHPPRPGAGPSVGMLFDFETVSVVRLKGVRHGAISIGATATPGMAKIGFRSA